MGLIPRCIWGSLVVALLTPMWTFAQTTQPVAAPTTAPSESLAWQDVASNLAQRLSGSDLPALLKALRPVPPVIRSFSSDAIQPPERLLAVTGKSKVLGVHAYPKPPLTLAADIAEDFHNATDIPESVTRDMIPADDSAEKRANETAANWLAQTLQPEKDQAVAVIILWPSERRPGRETSVRRPIFVLVKARPQDGGYLLQQISYGDPLDAVR